MQDGRNPNRQEKRRSPWLVAFVVLTVVLITGSVGINMYADAGIERAQISEAVSLLVAAKTPLAEYFQDRRKWPAKVIEVADRTSGKYTESIAITQGAGGTGAIELTATMKTRDVREAVAGRTILLRSQDGQTWTCAPGTVSAKYLTAYCRN